MLRMPSAITTAEDLLKAGDIGRCELVRGCLVMMVPAGADHGRLANEIAFRLTAFVRSKGLGIVFGAETGFLLARDPDTVRAPDAAFVRQGRAAPPPRGYYPGAPDLAVEVVSPDDRPGEVAEKVGDWLGAGTRTVWVVDPRTRTVAVHEPDKPARVIRQTGILRGGRVLRGFELRVREIFE
jgi:Uma2 family endonuclease